MCVDQFFSALESDMYPDDATEGIFGVKMGDEIGSIVFNAWLTLIKYTGAATHASITEALVVADLEWRLERWWV